MTVGIRYSPIGLVARAITFGRPPEWVSAKPKRFAWTLGLGMTFAMTVITNSGIRGYLPRTICLICLTLMWMESALGLCLGCKIHGLLVRRGWAGDDPGYRGVRRRVVRPADACGLKDHPQRVMNRSPPPDRLRATAAHRPGRPRSQAEVPIWQRTKPNPDPSMSS